MEDIIVKIRSMYDDMGRSEKKIADYILEHGTSMIGLSITELSSICGCGDATVVRFSRRLGLSGYQELKIKIAQQTDTISYNKGITTGDTCYDIFQKRKSDVALALENTAKALAPDLLEQAASAISRARRILIIGLGSSAPVALDAQHKFLRAGLDAAVYSDNHMQAIAISHVSQQDVVIAISHSGASVDIVESLKLAKSKGATTIAVTHAGKSPLQKYSDITLHTDAEETQYSILGMSSRIAQLVIFDSIYSYLVLHMSDQVIREIEATEAALQGKKY